jgi:hypothetical protein
MALVSLAFALRCQADGSAIFENQTEVQATIKILGTERKQVMVKPKASERLTERGEPA